MQRVADWLDALGLGQYAETFAKNAIDLEILAELTDQDLEKLGVLLGHRRKLQRAIRELRGAGSQTPNPRRARMAPDAGERRQLTLMFCDLVGSTALSSRLDPEDLRRVYRAYRDGCSHAVARYDGTIAQFMGDGVLAYFGYPKAHEDDAERAVRAGLDIIATAAGLKTPSGDAIELRVGIATGLVVVDNSAAPGSMQEQAAVGATANLAARLQALAKPGTVIVAAATQKLLGRAFQLRAHNELTVAGLPEPIDAWEVQGEAAAESRFDMVRASRLTSFVGRHQEFARLHEAQQKAWLGDGQIVLIAGEAGIGKSRFTSRFIEMLAEQPYMRLRYQCSPYHSMSAFHPVIEQFKRGASWQPDDSPAIKFGKLETMLSLAVSNVSEVAPLFAALLSLPAADRYPELGLSAAQTRQHLLRAMMAQIEGLSRRQPVLVLFEDLHWADASSLELLDLLARRISQLPVLIIVTHRPEFEASWAKLPNATTIVLNRLDQTQAHAMIDDVTRGKTLPDAVTRQILTKTDGVPLFVEELTKAVLESGLLVEEADSYRLDGPLPPLAIPATLQDSLTARLDRLAPVREVAEIGALIGREFPYALLAAVADRDRETLDDALAQLEAAELLFRIGAPPNVQYRFKHALVQDAAYESMLRSRRQLLHRRIAETLRDDFPATAAEQPEIIARHFEQAGLADLAIDWWLIAGDRASRRSAYTEAGTNYREAIALAEKSIDQPAHRLRLVRLYVAYGQVSHTGSSPGAQETIAAFARARELAGAIPDISERFLIYHGLWVSSVVQADIAAMRQLSAAILQDAADSEDPQVQGFAQRCAGVVGWMSGDPFAGRSHLEAAVTTLAPFAHKPITLSFDLHPLVVAELQLALARCLSGDAEQGQRGSREALQFALRNADVPTLAYAYTWKSTLDILRLDIASTIVGADALRHLGDKHNLPFWKAIGAFFGQWARWKSSDQDVDLRTMRQALQFFVDARLTLYCIFIGTLFAAPQAANGDIAGALNTIDQVLSEIERTDLRWIEAEAHRQRAEILLQVRPADDDAIRAAFQRAIAVARRQHATHFERRALASYQRSGLAPSSLPSESVTDEQIAR